MQLLEASQYTTARGLYAAMPWHLAPQAILAGRVPGAVYVDQGSNPKSALVKAGHRFYLAGEPGHRAFQEGLATLFFDEIYPQALATGEDSFVLYYAPAGWEPMLDSMLRSRHPMQLGRQHYAFYESSEDRCDRLPSDAELRPIDGALLADERLPNLDKLRDEVLSEGPSVEHYLKNRFGCCVVGGDGLRGWCLSEHNLADRCEVGIYTLPAYRKQGLATAMACGLVRTALSRELAQIGWHCYSSNKASIATARKVGFVKTVDYRVYYAWFDATANLAVHGNVCFQRQRYAEAVEWYGRAFRTGQPPVWALVNAACAYAVSGDPESAMKHLWEAAQHGFSDVAHLKSSAHLVSLHGRPEWKSLVSRLEATDV